MKLLTLPLTLLLVCTMLFAQNSIGQKEARVEQLKELPASKAHITKEIETQIIEIVKPVKDKIEKLFNEDLTGNAKAYRDDLEKISKITDAKEQTLQLQNVQKKYYAFIKGIWAQAKINDADYQQKLKSIFPSKIRETIRFGDFLNFKMGGSYQKDPPPPAPPAPAGICVDANAMFRGTFGVDGGAIGGTRVIVAPARPPSPAEIVASATTAIVGIYRSQGWLHNTISIPGTFPIDSKLIRSKKTFSWRGTGTAFTFLGCSWSTVAFSTNPDSDDFSNGGEIHSVVAPVTFIQGIDEQTTMAEESLIPKTDLHGIQFGITCYASASASIFLSFATSTSSCALTKWEICEE